MQYIFVHGLGQDSLSWRKTAALMAGQINAQLPDLSECLNGINSGSTNSGNNKEMTYENLYHAFSEYCNATPEPINLCGLSLGGVLALNYTIDYPEKVHSLILIGTQYKIPKTLLKIQNIVFQLMPEFAFKNMGFKKKDVIKLTKSMVDLDFSENLTNIACPVLIMCGDKDKANKNAARHLSENIPGAEFQLVDKANHEVNISNPQLLASKIKNFYNEISD